MMETIWLQVNQTITSLLYFRNWFCENDYHILLIDSIEFDISFINFSVLFQFLEHSEPHVHLYKLIELQAEEDANAHKEALTKAFKNDQIFDLLKGIYYQAIFHVINYAVLVYMNFKRFRPL